MRIRQVIYSWDFAFSASVSVVFALWLPSPVPNDLAKDYYSVGITVLSIVFSIFFAALAIIIAASDDDFIAFLEEDGHYSAILFTFRFALGVLFFALTYSLFAYAYTAGQIARSHHEQARAVPVLFCFLSLWGLFAAFSSTSDAIKYSEYRRRFTSQSRKPKAPQ